MTQDLQKTEGQELAAPLKRGRVYVEWRIVEDARG